MPTEAKTLSDVFILSFMEIIFSLQIHSVLEICEFFVIDVHNAEKKCTWNICAKTTEYKNLITIQIITRLKGDINFKNIYIINYSLSLLPF